MSSLVKSFPISGHFTESLWPVGKFWSGVDVNDKIYVCFITVLIRVVCAVSHKEPFEKFKDTKTDRHQVQPNLISNLNHKTHLSSILVMKTN